MGDRDERPLPPSTPDGPDARRDERKIPPTSGSRDEESRPKDELLRRSVRNASMHSIQSDTSEDEGQSVDPRKIGLENAVFGDYDMKRSASTNEFVLSYIEDKMARQLNKKRRDGSVDSESDQESNKKHIEIEYDDSSQNTKDLARAIFNTATDVYMEGVESIVSDNFWKCFEEEKPRPWNWNLYLWPLWFFGVIIRYFFLFPVRLIIFALGWVLFGIGMLTVQLIFPRGPTRVSLEHSLISMMCGVFCITWGAVIRYHGSPIEPRKGSPHPVYIANHTSMIDVIILQQMRCFSLVGQRHKGIVRFLQETVLGCLQCIWFERSEIKDRAAVATKLGEHVKDPTRNPLLVFPEGTCVNNEYVIQFKKGIFEIADTVVPIAIKYNKMFVDPFWNSRAQSFPMHLVELMTSWCLICDVWYLEPHVKNPSESATEFAARCKQSIAEQAGLKNVDMDGYMKHFRPSERFLRGRQTILGESIKKIFAKKEEETNYHTLRSHHQSTVDFTQKGQDGKLIRRKMKSF